MNGGEEGRRIPISYPDADRPLITTTGKVLAWGVTIIGAVVVLTVAIQTNRFQAIVDRRFDQFELRLVKEYALKGDAVMKAEYELRHKELVDHDSRISDRQNEDERRMNDLAARVLQLERGTQQGRR